MRFSEILSYCTKKYNRVSRFYKISQIFIIICSIINPALLSVNINQNNSNYIYIFWVVWVLQIAVSLVTGFVSLYKWDKKNFLFNIYKTKINKEIWLFIGLTGKNYKSENDSEGDKEYNHSKYINVFLNRLEAIHTQLKISEFETEANNNDDDIINNNNSTNNKKNNTRYTNNYKDILTSRRANVGIPDSSEYIPSRSPRTNDFV